MILLGLPSSGTLALFVTRDAVQAIERFDLGRGRGGAPRAYATLKDGRFLELAPLSGAEVQSSSPRRTGGSSRSSRSARSTLNCAKHAKVPSD